MSVLCFPGYYVQSFGKFQSTVQTTNRTPVPRCALLGPSIMTFLYLSSACNHLFCVAQLCTFYMNIEIATCRIPRHRKCYDIEEKATTISFQRDQRVSYQSAIVFEELAKSGAGSGMPKGRVSLQLHVTKNPVTITGLTKESALDRDEIRNSGLQAQNTVVTDLRLLVSCALLHESRHAYTYNTSMEFE
ncbi:bfc0d993-99bf-4042-b716-087b4c592871 [Sclerotinia trifoliorum]|uniref:Bfc0d993-99bf-4042-b716-087b4c592871 n=1 Tax=Sclerotinia trifoliorum TaxID=28548 RepID=A0A8H2ZJL7_9HELO|nr:bfc0d993-99bf-4042-b716-087b4c592871 [Sclerotinia trifoliorum]